MRLLLLLLPPRSVVPFRFRGFVRLRAHGRDQRRSVGAAVGDETFANILLAPFKWFGREHEDGETIGFELVGELGLGFQARAWVRGQEAAVAAVDVGLVVGVVEEFDEGGEMGRFGEDGWGEDLGFGFWGWRRRGHGWG